VIFEKEITDSATLKFAEVARSLNRKGIKIISLGLGEPDFPTPDYIIKATYRAMISGFTRYSNTMGLLELRKKIADSLISSNNIQVKPDNIIITPGAKQAIFFALMSILKPGDEIINITPSYVSYNPCIKIAEPKSCIIEIPLNKKDLSVPIEEIKKAVTPKTKAILLNSPNNPTGKIFSYEEIETIVNIAKKYKIFIISDEIYNLLNYSGEKTISPASFKEVEDLIITINGFSKAYSMTGWRIGYAVFPEKLREKFFKLQQHINTNTCTFVQKGAIEALDGDKNHIMIYNNKLKERARAINNVLKSQSVVSFVLPKGGLFAFLNISKSGMKSNDFAVKLIEKEHIATTPGIAFGKDWDDYIRISLATNKNDLYRVIKLICDFAEFQRKNIKI
jgi:aspartate aminotransferase